MDECYEDGKDSSNKELSTESKVDSGSTSNSNEDVDTALLVVDKEFEETSMAAFVDGSDDDYDDLYGVIEEGAQSKLESNKTQDLVVVVPSMSSVSKVNAMAERWLEGVVTMVLTIFEWLIAWLMIHAIWWLNYQTIICHFYDEEGVQMLFSAADHE